MQATSRRSHRGGAENTKFEARNPNFETRNKFKMKKIPNFQILLLRIGVLNFPNFEFNWLLVCFGFRCAGKTGKVL